MGFLPKPCFPLLNNPPSSSFHLSPSSFPEKEEILENSFYLERKEKYFQDFLAANFNIGPVNEIQYTYKLCLFLPFNSLYFLNSKSPKVLKYTHAVSQLIHLEVNARSNPVINSSNILSPTCCSGLPGPCHIRVLSAVSG